MKSDVQLRHPSPPPLPRAGVGLLARHQALRAWATSAFEAPLQVMDSGASGCCLQWLHHHARASWSAVHMDHRGARVRRGRLTDRAGQLDPCRAALPSLQDHRVLCLDCSHAAWAVSWRLLCTAGRHGRGAGCRLNQALIQLYTEQLYIVHIHT